MIVAVGFRGRGQCPCLWLCRRDRYSTELAGVTIVWPSVRTAGAGEKHPLGLPRARPKMSPLSRPCSTEPPTSRFLHPLVDSGQSPRTYRQDPVLPFVYYLTKIPVSCPNATPSFQVSLYERIYLIPCVYFAAKLQASAAPKPKGTEASCNSSLSIGPRRCRSMGGKLITPTET